MPAVEWWVAEQRLAEQGGEGGAGPRAEGGDQQSETGDGTEH